MTTAAIAADTGDERRLTDGRCHGSWRAPAWNRLRSTRELGDRVALCALSEQMSGHVRPIAAEDQAKMLRGAHDAAFVVGEHPMHVRASPAAVLPEW
ncbi:hypothetical protein O7635_15460 [Asanoa sp. WMMD1127]|uniref:hypothetical protein n=1 Tax=Asanoa sp. WMMD1127 TaxID=3016107 RepID=UPI002417BA79|nr:hypothetical protein [Asanoa sp. WMMD1127]MDG4823253.1 hypothetical protein [Asanoa sp. WMMD1127]